MGIIDTLIEADKQLLICINSYHSPLWDNFFWIVTSVPVWIPLYLTIVYVFIKNHSFRGIWPLIFMGLMVFLCDRISSGMLKPFFERLRPTHELDIKDMLHIVNNYRGGRFGFVSSHAANSFGLATFLSLFFRNKWFSFIIFLWASLVAYSRIYLGVHYPGDIIGGALLGITIAWIIYRLFIHFLPRFIFISHHNTRTLKKGLSESISIHSINLLSYSIVLTFIIIFISSKVFLKFLE
ncbi:MAG: phosphatase PAP2 family protein [Chlorobi bacterium]|nr:phosphatase PAP2 family protein [Chlorobiota bacterium]